MTILSRSRPRCPRCGSPLATFRGESYCPNDTTYGLSPDLSTQQVLLLMVLRGKGWPEPLTEYLLSRCSAEPADLNLLIALGLVRVEEGHYDLTHAGLRKLAAEKQTHKHWL